MRFAPAITAVDELLFRSPLVCIGRFECPRDHPLFVNSGPASAHLFVFPRSEVRIRHLGRAPFATTRNMATLYNPGEEFRREALSPEGDRCDWFAVAPELAREVVGSTDPRAAEDLVSVFRFEHAPSDAASYLEQRLTVEHAASGACDPLQLEEASVRLLDRLLRSAYARITSRDGAHGAARGSRRSDRDLAEAARELLAADIAEPLALAGVARAVGSSVFHLCRAFKRVTGSTLHGYRNELRLRRSLDLIADRPEDLTSVALDVGFSSHSHFTQAFRELFGLTPARFRRQLALAGARGEGLAPRRPRRET